MNKVPLFGLIHRNGFQAVVVGMMSPPAALGFRRKGGNRSSVGGPIIAGGGGKFKAPYGLNRGLIGGQNSPIGTSAFEHILATP